MEYDNADRVTRQVFPDGREVRLGYDLNSNGTPDCSDATADTDGDGTNNPSDTDDDGDGFSDVRENFIATKSLSKCPATSSDYAWGPDVNNNRTVSLSDAFQFGPYFLAANSSDPVVSRSYNMRVDWNMDGRITLSDVFMMGPYFLMTCTP